MEGVKTSLPGTRYRQFGKDVLFTQMPFHVLEAIFEVDHDVQRQLDPRKRREIRDFILESLEQKLSFYFSPFVFSSRQAIVETAQGFELSPGSKVYINDGQHRTAALSSALSHLQAKIEAAEEVGDEQSAEKMRHDFQTLRAYPVAMQIYLELGQQEEKQLFCDLNTERCEAHPGLRMQYDERDAYTLLTRNVANELTHIMEIEMEASRLTIQNASTTSLITMRKCLLALFEGQLSEKKGNPYFRNCKPSQAPQIAREFFETWSSVFPQRMKNREDYVCTTTGVQVALAQTAHTLVRGEGITYAESFALLKLLHKQCTWRHDDPAFAHMYDALTGRIKHHSNSTTIKRTVIQFLKMIDKERTTNVC